MTKGRTCVTLGAPVVLFVAAICCLVLGLQVLLKENIARAGIATLSFNLTDIHLPSNLLVMPRVTPRGDIFQSVQSQAQSVANAVSTAVPGAISNVKSAANTAATAIPDINAVEALIPRNCSLGTKQFCVGFDTHTDCNNLPLNLSIIIPEAITSFVPDQTQALQQLEGILKKLTPANFQYCLISGLVITLVVASMFFSSMFSQLLCVAIGLPRLGNLVRMIVCSIPVLVCCILFVIPTVTLYAAQSEIQKIRSSIEVDKGGASSYCLGLVCCATVMLVATIAPVFT